MIALHIRDMTNKGPYPLPSTLSTRTSSRPSHVLLGVASSACLPDLRVPPSASVLVLASLPPRHPLPNTYDDTITTTATFSDLDLSFYARNTHPQRCRTDFEDAACLWNNNVPTSLSPFCDYIHPRAGTTLTSHRPPNPPPLLFSPDFGTGLSLTYSSTALN